MNSLASLFTHRSLATIYLVVMCTQILMIEGFGVSPLEVCLMGLAPLIFVIKVPYLTKPFWIGVCYMLVVLCCAMRQSYVRFPTIGYLFMFVMTFILYCNLIYDNAFSLEEYRLLLKNFIIAFFYCAILQQVFSSIGLRNIPLFNMVGQSYLSFTHFNTLTFEPSSSARILAFLFLGFLRMEEVSLGYKPSIRYLWDNHKGTLLMFIYVMLFMGSGTAMIAMVCLSLYFLQRKSVLFVLPLLIAGYCLMVNIDYLPVKRMVNAVNATMTFDVDEITTTDNSAAVRINPLINTFTKTDITSSETWFGKGTVSVKERENWYSTIKTAKMGNIDQYGLLSFLIGIILVYICCLPKLLSLETALSFLLIGFTVNNFSYIWGCYYILATTKYFYTNYKSDEENS